MTNRDRVLFVYDILNEYVNSGAIIDFNVTDAYATSIDYVVEASAKSIYNFQKFNYQSNGNLRTNYVCNTIVNGVGETVTNFKFYFAVELDSEKRVVEQKKILAEELAQNYQILLYQCISEPIDGMLRQKIVEGMKKYASQHELSSIPVSFYEVACDERNNGPTDVNIGRINVNVFYKNAYFETDIKLIAFT